MPAGEELLRKGRALFAVGEGVRARDAIAAGLEAERGSGSAAEAALAVELARLRTSTQWDAEPSLEAARLAVQLAQTHRSWEHRALLELAKANLIGLDVVAVRQAESAFRASLAVHDSEGFLEAATWLVQMHLGWGRLPAAVSLARWIGDAATREGKLPYVASARWQEARLRWLGGDTSPAALDAFRSAASDPALGPLRAQAKGELAVALADGGFVDLARETLRSAATDQATEFEVDMFAFYRAEVEFLGGRPAQSTEAAAASFASGSGLAHIAADWSLVLAGRPARGGEHPLPHALGGLADERDGLVLLGLGENAAAAELLLAAAAKHEPHLFRHHLRCLLGAGLALLRSGAADEGRSVLREAEAAARGAHSDALLARIRAALRGTGPEGRAGGERSLSLRQSEVLRLVSQGLTTAQISARIGIAPSSVETHLRQARGKLGARTRIEAALASAGGTPTSVPLRREVSELAALLADGATLGEAATVLGVSPRTAARRAAELRAATGAARTVVAVSRAVGPH